MSRDAAVDVIGLGTAALERQVQLGDGAARHLGQGATSIQHHLLFHAIDADRHGADLAAGFGMVHFHGGQQLWRRALLRLRRVDRGQKQRGDQGVLYFHIGLPLPGRPSADHFSVTRRITSGSIAIFWPHSRLVSGGSLLVASSPILEPSPLCGEAKSR